MAEAKAPKKKQQATDKSKAQSEKKSEKKPEKAPEATTAKTAEQNPKKTTANTTKPEATEKTAPATAAKKKTQKSPAKKTVKVLAAARPIATVYSIHGRPKKTRLKVPDVLLAPIRADLVHWVHKNMSKNARQPYGVQYHNGPKGIVAGHQVRAQSWGTGRAVSRIPRVKGGGTHRAGQGAFGNMCRGGRMFAPTKVWRRWHRKINVNQKRYAVASAVAASSLPALVMARGHRVQGVEEIPLVVENDFEKIKKTQACVLALQKLKLGSELNRCKSRYKRAGKGKARNRRFKHRIGPLIVYRQNHGIVQAARNIRGVDLCRVDKLNLLKLCPGGHVGRMIIWTEGAFRRLNNVFGTQKKRSSMKSGYHLPRPLMKNSDLNRIINSQEVQMALRPKRVVQKIPRKRNPLKRPELYAKLNPLFEKQYKDILDKKKPGKALTTTTKLLRPQKKKQRVKIQITSEEKQQMKKYWELVVGESIFKTRERLTKERNAVKEKLAQLEKEKKGEDLLEKPEAKEET